MKHEVKLITIENNHSTIEEFEVSKFHFDEIHNCLTLVEEHKKFIKIGKVNEQKN